MTSPVTAPQEIECKFDVDIEDVDGLVARLCAAYGAARPPQAMTSVYFDTARHRLRKQGLTLRVRHVGSRHIQTVKQGASPSSGLFERQEWETAIDGREPDLHAAARTPVAKTLNRHRGRLAPLFETVVERTQWCIARDGATVEIVLDRGEVRTTSAVQPICEVEFELKAGPPAALFATLRHLQADGWLQPSVLAKSERGFGLLDGSGESAVKAEPIALDPDLPTGAAVQIIIRNCLRQFRRNAALLEDRRPEPLHQARVGLRRLRSALTLFKPVLHDGAFDDIASRLREVSGQLGAARDLDVYLQRLAGPEAERLDAGPGAGAFLAAAQGRRDAAYDGLLETLGSRSFRRLMLDLFMWLEAGEWLTIDGPGCGTNRDRPIAALAADLLKAQRRKMRRQGRGLKRLSPEARHRFRIAAKKLRYAADFTASLAHRPAEKARHATLVKALETLQADLGDLNDTATGHRLAAELAGLPDGANAAFSVGYATGEAEARSEVLLRSAVAGRRAVLHAKPFWSRW